MRGRGTTSAGAGTRLGARTQAVAFLAAAVVVAGLATVMATDRDPGGRATASPPPSATSTAAAPVSLDPACLAARDTPTGARVPADDPYGTSLTEYGPHARVARLYGVNAGHLYPLDGLTGVRPCDEQLWRMAETVGGRALASQVDQLLLVGDADASSADAGGPAGAVLGEVTPLLLWPRTGSQEQVVDPAHWRLTLAPYGVDAETMTATVAHEMGHVLSLGKGEVDQTPPDDCRTWVVSGGCAHAGGILDRWLTAQWPDALLERWDETVADADLDTDAGQRVLEDFVDAHPDTFVDDYAATDPTEDFAETFSLWCVLGEDGEDGSDAVHARLHDIASDPSVTSVTGAGCARIRAGSGGAS